MPCQLAPPSTLYSYEMDPPGARLSTVCRRMASTGLGAENGLETSVPEPPVTSAPIWDSVSPSADAILLSSFQISLRISTVAIPGV